MKKTFALFLLLTLTFSLVACGEKKLEEFEKNATIEETVLYNENDIMITANELSYDTFSAKLSITIQNLSDKNLSFSCGSMGYDVNSINGYMVQCGFLNCDVNSGESKTEEIKFDFKSLNTYGITKISDIEIGFSISDEEYNHIYTGPLKINSSIFDSYDYSENTYQKIVDNGAFESAFECKIDAFSKDELYNNYGISIVSSAVVTNKDGEPALLLEIKNGSSERICFSTKEVSLNDKLVYDSLWSSDAVNSGKTFVKNIPLTSLVEKYDGNKEDVETVSKISFKFSVGENWYNAVDSKEISISLPKVKVVVKEDK